MTAAAYLAGGLVTAGSLALIPQLIPGVIVGVPVGAFVIRHVKPETFRRVCMSFDAWIVSFGISTLLRALGVVPGLGAFAVTAIVVVLDSWLLYRFFTGKARAVDAPVDHPPLPIHWSAAAGIRAEAGAPRGARRRGGSRPFEATTTRVIGWRPGRTVACRRRAQDGDARGDIPDLDLAFHGDASAPLAT